MTKVCFSQRRATARVRRSRPCVRLGFAGRASVTLLAGCVLSYTLLTGPALGQHANGSPHGRVASPAGKGTRPVAPNRGDGAADHPSGKATIAPELKDGIPQFLRDTYPQIFPAGLTEPSISVVLDKRGEVTVTLFGKLPAKNYALLDLGQPHPPKGAITVDDMKAAVDKAFARVRGFKPVRIVPVLWTPAREEDVVKLDPADSETVTAISKAISLKDLITKTHNLLGVKVELGEELPSDTVEVDFTRMPIADIRSDLAKKYSLAFQPDAPKKGDTVYVFRTVADPPADGVVRLYQHEHKWRLAVRSAPALLVLNRLQALAQIPIRYGSLGPAAYHNLDLDGMADADQLVSVLAGADSDVVLERGTDRTVKAYADIGVAIWPLTFVSVGHSASGSVSTPAASPPADSSKSAAADAGKATSGTPAANPTAGPGSKAAPPESDGDAAAATSGKTDGAPASQATDPSAKAAPVPAATATSTATTADRAAKALNAFFGNGGSPVQAFGNSLLIRGNKKQIGAIEDFVARFMDIPYSQVRLDVWAIQINSKSTRSGSREGSQRRARTIRRGIALVKDLETATIMGLGGFVTDHAPEIDRNMDGPLKKLLETAGFSPTPQRPLTVAESLIFLELCDKKGSALQKSLRKSVLRLVDSDLSALGASDDLAGLRQRIKSRVNGAFLTRCRALFPDVPAPAVLRGLRNFLCFWQQNALHGACLCGEHTGNVNIAAGLTHASAATDMLLKNGMSALSADIEEAFTQSLLDWIRDEVQGGSAANSGIDLVGQTSIVVTSRLPASVNGNAENYATFTPGVSMADILNTLNGDSSSKLVSAAANAIGKVNPAFTLGIAALLTEKQATYTKIAPGIQMQVTPTVLPDGGTARLVISLQTNLANDRPADGTKGQPLDSIPTHVMTTDVAVGAFDLFTLSTLSFQSTRPGDPWRIPILNSLPLVGKLFQGPTRETVNQESVLLINVSILPKSLDLAKSY
jgi:hypothetical protein